MSALIILNLLKFSSVWKTQPQVCMPSSSRANTLRIDLLHSDPLDRHLGGKRKEEGVFCLKFFLILK